MPVLSGPGSENPMCRDVNRDIARSKRDISMMPGSHQQDSD